MDVNLYICIFILYIIYNLEKNLSDLNVLRERQKKKKIELNVEQRVCD